MMVTLPCVSSHGLTTTSLVVTVIVLQHQGIDRTTRFRPVLDPAMRKVVSLRLARTKRRFWACWALFALALQLAVSFGHVHDLGNRKDASDTLQVTFQDNARLAASSAPALSTHPAIPAVDCEICAAIYLTGNGVPGAAPQLRVPVFIDRMRYFVPVDAAPAIPLYQVFQPRAPPRA